MDRPLAELAPTWIHRGDGLRIVGIRFICPIDDGAGPHPEGHSICVLFDNPSDGGPAHPDDPACPGNSFGRRWQRTGETFDDLSLSPSVDCTRGETCPKEDHSACGHARCFHGHVTNGRVG